MTTPHILHQETIPLPASMSIVLRRSTRDADTMVCHYTLHVGMVEVTVIVEDRIKAAQIGLDPIQWGRVNAFYAVQSCFQDAFQGLSEQAEKRHPVVPSLKVEIPPVDPESAIGILLDRVATLEAERTSLKAKVDELTLVSMRISHG